MRLCGGFPSRLITDVADADVSVVAHPHIAVKDPWETRRGL